MKKYMLDNEIINQIKTYGADILNSANMQKSKGFISHSNISCYDHSLSVAYLSLRLSKKHRSKCDCRSLVRGALLHDFYLYDWHIPDKSHRLHGYSHAHTALVNACREFELNKIEMDIIEKHMFPLNLKPPKYRESRVVCIADKLCSLCETLSIPLFQYRIASLLK